MVLSKRHSPGRPIYAKWSGSFVVPAITRRRCFLGGIVVLSGDRAFERADSLSQGGANIGKTLRPKNQQKNDQQNDYPLWSGSEHHHPSRRHCCLTNIIADAPIPNNWTLIDKGDRPLGLIGLDWERSDRGARSLVSLICRLYTGTRRKC